MSQMETLKLDGTPGGTAKASDRGVLLSVPYGAAYEQACLRGEVFSASNVAAQAVSVALTTTYTGLCISNPLTSKKNLVILAAQYAISVAEAAIASQHLIAGGSSTGIVTHSTALVAPGIQSCLIGSGAGVVGSGSIANADSACTIVNPYYLFSMRAGFTAAALGGGQGDSYLGGLFVVGPGGWIAWGALTAITGFGSFVWREVPI